MALVNTKELFKKAYEGKYAIGAFNICNMESIQGIVDAAKDEMSPVILQVSNGARKYAKPIYLKKMVEAAVIDSNIPIVLHLDHGDSFETCKECIDSGFTSVMIDGSHLSFEDNIALTKKVCDYAHSKTPYVSVEGELGKLAGIEDDVNVAQDEATYTNPLEVEEFVKRTGVDSLAIAIGTSHGAFKFKSGTNPMLRFDILEEIERRLPGFPIVLHGASSIPKEYVDMFKKSGGDIDNPIGISEEMISKASKMSVCKVNIDSDIRLASYSPMRKYIIDNPTNFDPRKPLDVSRENIKNSIRHKIKNVLGSSDKI
ncbi:MAG: class II fructose-1,6-bisphosphate aldolase [Anaeroplasmataceae bacterium]